MTTHIPIDKTAIFIDQVLPDYAAVLDFAAQQLALISAIEPQLIANALHEREVLGCTAIGCGFALPHGRVNRIKGNQAHAIFIRTKTACDCDSPDQLPVRFFLPFIVSPSATQLHLNILSLATEQFINNGVAFWEQADVEELHRVLTQPASLHFVN